MRTRTIKIPPYISRSNIDRKKLIEVIRRLYKERIKGMKEDWYKAYVGP